MTLKMDKNNFLETGLIDELFRQPCYGLDKTSKADIFLPYLKQLTEWHRNNCQPYAKILQAHCYMPFSASSLEELPFIPVRLFKDFDLASVPKTAIIKTLTSSGTSSQKVSRIFLDKITSAYQTKALIKLIQEYLGKQRLPMLIIDHAKVVTDRTLFSARGAGILGLSNFGRDHTYLLNDDMQIDFKALEQFMEKYQSSPIFIFGFTFMVWQYFYQPLLQGNQVLNIPNATLIHSGGWKKLLDQAVDNRLFKAKLKEQTGIVSVYNFYGMVEQTGSIFLECEESYFHSSIYSDIIIRNPIDWSVMPDGKEGIIQVMSLLPHSYPGQNLLTEDLGVILGEDNCRCGRKGKFFKVSGRIPQAEIRGCSDTHSVS